MGPNMLQLAQNMKLSGYVDVTIEFWSGNRKTRYLQMKKIKAIIRYFSILNRMVCNVLELKIQSKTFIITTAELKRTTN